MYYWRIARCLLYGCAPMTKSKTLNELKYPWICRVIDIVGETLSPCSVPNREKVENFSVPLLFDTYHLWHYFERAGPLKFGAAVGVAFICTDGFISIK